MQNPYEKAISKYARLYKRIGIIDFLRGFCALLMVFDHTMYDFRYVISYLWRPLNDFSRNLIDLANLYWSSDLRAVGWILAVSCFVFLCGVSTGLSRNNLLRGFRLLVVALLITVVSSSFEIIMNMSGIAINFGVLHTLSFCILIYALCAEGGKRIKLFRTPRRTYYLSDLLTLLLFVATSIATIIYGIIPSDYVMDLRYSNLLEMDFTEFWSYALGLRQTLSSSDYIPMLPWISVFFAGAFFSGSINRVRDYSAKKAKQTDFVSTVGRNSLILYIVHQPVIYVLLYIIGVIVTGKIILL